MMFQLPSIPMSQRGRGHTHPESPKGEMDRSYFTLFHHPLLVSREVRGRETPVIESYQDQDVPLFVESIRKTWLFLTQ